ncbi:MAG: NAD-dependent epimerase/dehydratase family protein [Anaerolineaceae bacterium]|nr:NAD-dependent epimerase/dehydratase family protein [Anaerolineaceae bacterium]
MRILITGVGGFVGRHLFNTLCNQYPDAIIHGTAIDQPPQMGNDRLQYHLVDLKNYTAIHDLIAQIEPNQIYHLAAQSSPRKSFLIPWETLENNIKSQLNIIQACIALKLQPRMLVISSAEIYGPVRPDQLPINEDAPLRPTNPYGVSKVAQDMLGLQYYMSHKLPILRARPFNHFGPGQSEGFVATDFAVQVARIEAGLQESVIEVGNLAAERDFTDVRDVVSAYTQIMEKGVPGAVYNVASGTPYSIQYLLDVLLKYSTVTIQVRVSPARMMPIDVPVVQGDTTRLQMLSGWQPSIPFETTLLDVLNDWRGRVRQAKQQ